MEKITLSPEQIKEIHEEIEKSLGVELKKEQVHNLFDKGVENLTDQLNKIIK